MTSTQILTTLFALTTIGLATHGLVKCFNKYIELRRRGSSLSPADASATGAIPPTSGSGGGTHSWYDPQLCMTVAVDRGAL